MKKNYKSPEAEVLSYTVDVIAASTLDYDANGGYGDSDTWGNGKQSL